MHRTVHLVNVDTGAGGGAVDVSRIDVTRAGGDVRMDDVPVHRGFLAGADVEAREELARRVDGLEARSVGDGLLLDDASRNAPTLRLALARRALDRWDFDHVLSPLIGALALPAILVFHGCSGVPRLDLRSALREGIRAGALPCTSPAELVCLPTWAETGEALCGHLAELSLSGLPEVDPARISFLLGPPPPDEFLETLADMSPDDVRDVLAEMPSDVEAVVRRALVRADFIDEARRAGHHVVPEATSIDLAGAPGDTLFLVAHQDEQGIHLFDGAIAAEDVRRSLSARRGPSPPPATVDLSVCRADRSGNLAATFQGLGATVVLTRGDVGYEASMFHRLRRLVELLGSGHRGSLPELHDRVWALDSGLVGGC